MNTQTQPSTDRVASDVLDVLRQGKSLGNLYFLPQGQLDRKLYERTNEVLTRLGGKWNRVAKTHVFPSDDTDELIAGVLESESMPKKNPNAYFPTPKPVVDQMIQWVCNLELNPGARVLEPSAGTGAIAEALNKVWAADLLDWASLSCCEIDGSRAVALMKAGFLVVDTDFLLHRPQGRYDLIVMNPPFAVEGDRLAYITHIRHAWSLLAQGGVICSVAPIGWQFREDRRCGEFRAFVDEHGTGRLLPPDAFKESGTLAACCLILLKKEN